MSQTLEHSEEATRKLARRGKSSIFSCFYIKRSKNPDRVEDIEDSEHIISGPVKRPTLFGLSTHYFTGIKIDHGIFSDISWLVCKNMSGLQMNAFSEELLRETEEAKIRLIKLRRAAAIDERLQELENERVSLVDKLRDDLLACLICYRKFGDVVLHRGDEHRVCSSCHARGVHRCPACEFDLREKPKTPLADRLFGHFPFKKSTKMSK